MTKTNQRNIVYTFFNNNADSYDSIVHWTTLGKDKSWKDKILTHLSKEQTVLDLACGTGILTELIAKKLPHAKIIGVDITNTYLEKARKKLFSYKNIFFVNKDAEKIKFDERFDCITASYLPKYCNPDVLIDVCLEHLKVGGKIILHDFTYPNNRIIKKLWNFYFKILYLVGFFVPEWKNVFILLPAVIRTSNWVEKYEKIMNQRGLKVQIQNLTCGCSSIITGTKTI